MTTLEIWLWVGAAVLVVAGPIICSAVICVPKWWRRQSDRLRRTAIGGRLIGFIERHKPDPKPEPKKPVHPALIAIHAAITLVLVSPIVLLVAWVDAWRLIITRACPYTESSTDSWVREGVDEAREDWRKAWAEYRAWQRTTR